MQCKDKNKNNLATGQIQDAASQAAQDLAAMAQTTATQQGFGTQAQNMPVAQRLDTILTGGMTPSQRTNFLYGMRVYMWGYHRDRFAQKTLSSELFSDRRNTK